MVARGCVGPVAEAAGNVVWGAAVSGVAGAVPPFDGDRIMSGTDDAPKESERDASRCSRVGLAIAEAGACEWSVVARFATGARWADRAGMMTDSAVTGGKGGVCERSLFGGSTAIGATPPISSSSSSALTSRRTGFGPRVGWRRTAGAVRERQVKSRLKRKCRTEWELQISQ